MEIKIIGNKSVLLKGKKENVLINPDKEVIESNKFQSRIVVYNDGENNPNLIDGKVIITGPGEYEVGGVEINGVNAGNGQAVYIFNIDGLSACFLGDLKEKLSEKKIEKIDSVDILITQITDRKEVGNKTVLDWAKKWGVNYLIPSGYSEEELKKFLDDADMEGLEPIDALKVEKGDLPDGMEIVVLRKI